METEIENGLNRLNHSGFKAVYRPQVIGFRGYCMDIPILEPEDRDSELLGGYFEIEPIEGRWFSRVLDGKLSICATSNLDTAINSVIDFFEIVRKLGKMPIEISQPLFVCQQSGFKVSVISDQEIILQRETSTSEQSAQTANTESDDRYTDWRILIDDKNWFLITQFPSLMHGEQPICFNSLKEAVDHILNEQGKPIQNNR
jgi:hypothetical protein